MEFKVKYSNGIFIGETTGDAEAEKFGDLLDEMLSHDKWKPGMSWLHDHTKLNAGPLTVDDVKRIADLCVARREQIGAGKCAVVLARDLEFGLTRMWAVFVEGRWDSVADVFRSREKAITWLSS